MNRLIDPTDPPTVRSRWQLEPLSTALARLETRWGSTAIRLGNGDAAAAEPASFLVEGALAPLPHLTLPPSGPLVPIDDRIVPTGFPALDAILGPGGLVREAQVTLRGDESCGKTTLALRLVAEAQARGSIAAWLDLGRTFDPLEAAARGVDLAWLLVLRTPDTTEGLRLAGALLGGRTVEVLVADLPERMPVDRESLLRRLLGSGWTCSAWHGSAPAGMWSGSGRRSWWRRTGSGHRGAGLNWRSGTSTRVTGSVGSNGSSISHHRRRGRHLRPYR